MCTHMYVRARDCVCVGTGGRVLCVRARAVACRMRGERTRELHGSMQREREANATGAREYAE